MILPSLFQTPCRGAEFLVPSSAIPTPLPVKDPWEPKFGLNEGLDKTIKFFKNNLNLIV